MTNEEKQHRNQVLAATVGGFILPFAGLVGAFVFYSRGDEKAAKTVGIASFAGAIAYGVVLGLLA